MKYHKHRDENLHPTWPSVPLTGNSLIMLLSGTESARLSRRINFKVVGAFLTRLLRASRDANRSAKQGIGSKRKISKYLGLIEII